MGRKTLDITQKRKIATQVLRWCKENMGVNNRRKSLPKVSVRINFRKDETERFIKGIYYVNENRIIVYSLNCETIDEVVSTIIHEYTHYQQSMKKYWEYFEFYYYSNHPYEKEARKNEEMFTKKCIRSIKKYLL
jgi:hypothetical protein